MAKDKALPFELKTPNAETRAAIQESRALVKARHARFNDGPEFYIPSTRKTAKQRMAGSTRRNGFGLPARIWSRTREAAIQVAAACRPLSSPFLRTVTGTRSHCRRLPKMSNVVSIGGCDEMTAR